NGLGDAGEERSMPKSMCTLADADAATSVPPEALTRLLPFFSPKFSGWDAVVDRLNAIAILSAGAVGILLSHDSVMVAPATPILLWSAACRSASVLTAAACTPAA